MMIGGRIDATDPTLTADSARSLIDHIWWTDTESYTQADFEAILFAQRKS